MSDFDFLLNNTKASAYGIYAIRRPNIPTPKKRVESVTVPYVEGSYIYDEDVYDDIKFSIECNFMAETAETFAEEARKAAKWCNTNSSQNSYISLSFTDDPDYFYKIKILTVSDIDRTSPRIGVFTIDVTCEPFPYHTSGNQFLAATDGTKFTNPATNYHKSYPIYVLKGSGSFGININDDTLLIYDFNITVDGTATIDTKELLVYDSDGTSLIGNTSKGSIISSSAIGDIAGLRFNSKVNTVYLKIPQGGSVQIQPNWRAF